MELTKEQIKIIQSTGNIKVNAVAGSGKTTTIIAYAQSRPKNSRILYLVFNKSVKTEAIHKFAQKGLSNVKVETAHSLAYKYTVPQYAYQLKKEGYTTNEMVEILQLQGNTEKHTEYIIANHINKYIAYFCNSDKEKVQDLNYLDTITDKKARTFVHTFKAYIIQQTRIFLSKMNKGEIAITHDFYLKKFQLSCPDLPYDFILFDEGQDASLAMLDVFLKQKATKVIVGDTHQQIYSWRYAINSLEKTDFTTYYLSTSFRFSNDIAKLAMEVLAYKKHIQIHKPIPISGNGTTDTIKTNAILARTNLGLLLKAITYITEHQKDKSIYFEGNIHSYTYADDGASLYDVLHLYNGKKKFIKDVLIKSMKNLEELESYIKKTEDVQLGMMLEIVKTYGNQIPDLIKQIKEKHVEDKQKADMIFSTVHRCKGMEYDSVALVDDFLTEDKLVKLIEDKQGRNQNTGKLNEEINLLYVAITRTKNILHIPEALMPKAFASSPKIIIQKAIVPQIEAPKMEEFLESEKKYTYEKLRSQHKAAYMPWTTQLDEELTIMYCNEHTVAAMAKHFGRTNGAIQSRIKKLDLVNTYG
jgi:F-box protein, helicase, 18